MNQTQNYRSHSSYDVIPVIKMVKWTYLPFLMLQFLMFLDTLVKYPTSLLKATKIFIDFCGWGYLIVFGPIIFIAAGINYFISQTNLANIPKDTTLYEAITRPTVTYGPVKIIFSKPKEENDILEKPDLEKL